MNNRFFKYSIFLVIGIILSITLFLLEYEKNDTFLLAQEQEKSINYLNNKNLQSSSTINSHTDNFKKSISLGAVNEIRTVSNHDNDKSGLTVHIPKGSFHPATNRII